VGVADEGNARVTPLGERIAAQIAADGPISVAQFMTLALHDRDAGYYATRDPFGVDFITAPEVSQMFGELIGLWMARVWMDQGKPKRPRLVELGPGRGTLMADALRALKLVPEFRAELEVVLVEASAALRKVQQQTLRDCGASVRWIDDFDDVAAGQPRYVVANEFFDALPIRQYVKTELGWFERMVTLDDKGVLAFILAPSPLGPALLPASRDGAPVGGVYEVSATGEAIAENISHAIARDGGAALIIDYGYDKPGFGETLQAVAANKFADVLADPGASDLSAHVDFTALSDAVRRGGASVCGPVEQGEFLVSLGIVERAEKLSRNHLQDMASQLDRLTNPDQMGTLFKTIAIIPKSAPTPPGF
jgi:NADH dehydrogenase [ubiquinone] 1 alpha subcomplex assembly factor 7